MHAISALVFLGLGGKICGLLRSVLMAQQFGSNMQTDAFMTALSGTVIFTSLSLTLTNGLIILYNKLKGDEEEKLRVVNNVLNVVMIASVAVTVLCYFASPLIIKILSKGFMGEQFDLAVLLFRIGLPSILMYNVAGTFRGYLNSHGSFVEYGIIQYTLNLTVIFYFVFFADKYGIKGLMVAQMIGVFTQLIVQLPFLKRTKYKYQLAIDFKDENVKSLFYIMLPIFMGVALSDINVIVDKTMASELAAGSITSLEYGSRINNMFLAIIVAPITRVLLPNMSSAYNDDRQEDFNKYYSAASTFLYMFALPATVYLMMLSEPVISLLFGRGEFGARAVSMSATAMMFYSLGLAAEGGGLICSKAFYSINDTKTPLYYSLLNIVLNIIFNFLFVGRFALGGLALSTAISSWICYLLKDWQLKKSFKYNYKDRDMEVFVNSVIGTLVMGVIVFWAKSQFMLGFSDVKTLLATLGLALVVYSVIILITMRQQLKSFILYFKAK